MRTQECISLKAKARKTADVGEQTRGICENGANRKNEEILLYCVVCVHVVHLESTSAEPTATTRLPNQAAAATTTAAAAAASGGLDAATAATSCNWCVLLQ